MSKFVKGEIVDFFRNNMLQDNNIPVIAVVPIFPLTNIEQIYIVEDVNGWTPDLQRKNLYELNFNTKYLFVRESELEAS